MAKQYYLGLDQGTTGITAVMLDENWNQAARGYREYTQIYPHTGWVEHDPVEIWQAALDSVQQALNQLPAGAQVACVGLDHEGESVVAWDKRNGKPIYNAIVWQDRRTAQQADALTASHGAMFREKTGLNVDAYFSATKLQWLLENVPEAAELVRSGNLLAGNMDAWLIWNMTHGRTHVTDASTASRTMLYNIHTQQWDADILDLLGIPQQILPTICDSSAHYDDTDPRDFLGLKIPIGCVMNDQQAALMGQACLTPGSVKTTYGTGCFMLMNTGDSPVLSENGIVTTVAWQLDKKLTFALDGGIYIAGAATQWLRDGLKIIRSASQTEAMARSVENNGGLYFVPAFTGLAAPYWDSYARGMMIGITGGTTDAHVVRATLESTAYQVSDVLKSMERDAGIPITRMRCDGGATVNGFLMQFQADILGIPLDVPQIADTTALGAASMAALGTGIFTSADQIRDHWHVARSYEPQMRAEQREELLHHWHRAIERAKAWAQD